MLFFKAFFLLVCVTVAVKSQEAKKEKMDDLVSHLFKEKDQEVENIKVRLILNSFQRERSRCQWVNFQPCNGGRGECVPYYLCVNGTAGSDFLDIKLINVSEAMTDGECVDYFEQCCPTENIVNKISSTT